jgi:hypothetical protein
LQRFVDEVININPKSSEVAKQGYEITPALLEESVITVHTQMKNERTRAHMTVLLTPDMRETGSVAARLECILADMGLPTKKAFVLPKDKKK